MDVRCALSWSRRFRVRKEHERLRRQRLAFLESLEPRHLLASVGVLPVDSSMSEVGPDGGVWEIRRDMPAPTPLTVYFTMDGDAVEGADYEEISPKSATIPANQISVYVGAMAIDDPFYEPTESVALVITPDPSYTISGGGAALMLISDDNSSAPLEPPLDPLGSDAITCDCPCTCGESTSTEQQKSNGGNNVKQNTGSAPLKNASAAASSQSVIETNASFTAAGAQADSIEATSTFNGAAGPSAYFSGSGVVAGEKYRIALPVDTSALESGYYEWEITVTEEYPHSPDVVRTIGGQSKVWNTLGSEFGSGWLHPEIDRLKIQTTGTVTKGALWLKGDGNAFWFAESSPGVFTRQAGEPDFSTLVKETDGTYTLTKKDGEKLRFTSDGILTSRTDRAGNATTYAYVDADGDSKSDEISTITYPGSLVVTFGYTGALVTSITDPYSRVTALGYTGGNLTTITEPDPDDAGPLAAPVTTFGYTGGLVSSITDAESNTTSFTYVNEMIRTVTHPGGGVETIHAQLGRALEDGLGSPGTKRALYLNSDVKATYTNEVGNTWTINFNKFGNALKVVDPAGKVTDYEINAENQVTKRTDADPDDGGAQVRPVTTFGYDSKGNVTSITHPDTTQETWTFDGTFSQPTSYTNRIGDQVTFVVDGANGNITEMRQVNGGGTSDSVTTLGYTTTNVKGLVSSVTDPRGFVTNYGRDAQGLVTSVTYAAGTADEAIEEFSYDAFDNLQWSEDGLDRRTDYLWDKLDRLTTITLPDADGVGPLSRPVYAYEYNKNNYLKKETDPLSRVTEYVYNGRNDLIEVKQPDPDGAGPLGIPVTTLGYDLHRRNTSVTDPLGRVTSFGYDSLDRNTTVTLPDPDGAGGPLTSPVTTYAYDNIHRAKQVTDALSNVTLLDHATWNRIAATLPDPDGGGPLGSSTVVTLFDAEGNVTSESDALGRITAYRYDNLGRLDQITYPDPDGAGPLTSPVVSLGYDKSSNLTSVTDALGNVTAYAYDGRNRLVSITEADPDGTGPLTSPVTSFTYNDANELVATTDALGGITTNAYDGMGRLSTVTAPDPDAGGPLAAPVTEYAYDAASRPISVTDPLGNVTTTAYDNLDRVTSITEPDPDAGGPLTSPVTSFTYDLVGNTLTLTDPVSNTTTWVYDDLDRVKTETNELAKTRTYEYDAVSNLKKLTDRNGRVIEYVYDNLYRNTQEIWKTGGVTDRTLSFTYDAAGQLTEASDPAATLSYVYDNLGRVTSQTQDLTGLTPSIVFAQGFDANSNRTSLTATIGGTADFKNTYTYDNLNRNTRITQEDQVGGNVVADKRVDLSYKADGQFDVISRFADLAGTQAVASSAYGYDGMGRLSSLAHTTSGGSTTLASYDYTFDAASRITSIDSLIDGVTSYTHDNTDQLTGADHTGATDESYTYDENGNRTMTGYSVGSNNRLLSDGTYNYTYDNEGNRLTRTNIATGDLTEYQWDHRNRLTKVTEKNSGGTVVETTEHSYDVFDRWVRRAHDADGAGSGAAVDTFFTNDGNQIALQFDGSAASDLSHRYLDGPAVDQIFADEQVTSLSSAGNTLWGLGDHLGTIRDIADRNESTAVTSVTNHRVYNSYGELTSESNAAVDLLFGFTGRAFDETTGLQNNWHRWYDPTVGQWISEDPIGFDGGDENLRRYVENQATRLTDPEGLSGWGKGGKLIVETLTKAGVKRTYYQIHHIIGREVFEDPKFSKWLAKLGIKKNCPDNLMALPTTLGKKKGFMKGAATHQGGPVHEYVDLMRDRLQDIMLRHKDKTKPISDDKARELIGDLQKELREGLENGTIALSREEQDIIAKGGVLSIGGLFLLAAPHTVEAAEHAREVAEMNAQLHEEFTECPLLGSYWFGEDSWIGWGVDMINPVDDFRFIMETFGDFTEAHPYFITPDNDSPYLYMPAPNN